LSQLEQKLNQGLDLFEIEGRKLLVSNLRDQRFVEIARQGPVFHDVLVRAQNAGWIHYTRLADALELSDSQVNRWFKPSSDKAASSRSTPQKFTIDAALKALADILEADVARLEAPRRQEPIGGQKIPRDRDSWS